MPAEFQVIILFLSKFRYDSSTFKSEREIQEFSLEIFKNIYARTKYALFKETAEKGDSNDYTRLGRYLRHKIMKAPAKVRNHPICLYDPCFGEEMSEYHPMEKLGYNATFDVRTGNQYTRKTFIKGIYNTFYGKVGT